MLKRKGDGTVSLEARILIVALIASLLFLGFLAWHDFSPVPNASAIVTSSNIGVYWDSAATRNVESINWGNVMQGSETYVAIYVKNLGTEPLVISMITTDWDPSFASSNIFLCWDYKWAQINPGTIVKIVLRLVVSPSIKGVSSFRFNVIIGVGLEKSSDFNGDGIVNISDVNIFARAWLSRAGSPYYNYRCDFNNDGVVNITDSMIFMSSWLQTSGQ
ncbi:MAG: dockerin type I domain-containing protein [Candidatus Bathyarchaeia archaeon]